MTDVDAVRQDWLALRDSLEQEARDTKQMSLVPFELSRRFGMISRDEDRVVVEAILSSWLLSDDPNDRFDAMAIVSDHSLCSAMSALESLSTKLRLSRDPGAPFEIAKADRIAMQLRNACPAPETE